MTTQDRIKIEHVYVRPDGVICACTVPKPLDHPCEQMPGHDCPMCSAYNHDLNHCKDPAVPFEDQESIAYLIFDKCDLPKGKPHNFPEIQNDVFIPISCEVEVIEKSRYEHAYIGHATRIVEKVARLITDSKEKPVQEEGQDKIYQSLWNLGFEHKQIKTLFEKFTMALKP